MESCSNIFHKKTQNTQLSGNEKWQVYGETYNTLVTNLHDIRNTLKRSYFNISYFTARLASNLSNRQFLKYIRITTTAFLPEKNPHIIYL